MSSVHLVAAVASAVIGTGGERAAPSIDLDHPRNGQVVRRHYVTVTGRFRNRPRGYAQILLDGERDAAGWAQVQRDGSFRGRVPLRPGANRVKVDVDIDTEEDGAGTAATRSVTVRRAAARPSRQDGTLDLATAWFVARTNLYLCGEAGGGCYSDPHCVRVTATRVDCPSTVHWDGEPGRCGVVFAIERATDRRVMFGTYRCPYVAIPRGAVRRFVRPWVFGDRERFVAEGRLDYTPHGVPQFDVFTNRLTR
jgi:hypothetical protein